MKKQKNYKLRSNVYKGLGISTIVLGSLGGFVTYESIIDWSNFKEELENFIVVNPQNVKLNLAIALPVLIGIIVSLLIVRKRNSDFFKNKVSLGLLISICFLYLVYCVIETTLAILIGAFAGAIVDEFMLTPVSKSAKKKYEENHDIDIEYEKEKRRITARKQAREELDGSV